MTMTLPLDAKNDLLREMYCFAAYEKKKLTHHTKWAWQRLAEWVNWGLNVFPLLAPCLCNIYAKLSTIPDNPNAQI